MSKKIKVLECIRQGQIGGGESHLLSLIENLDKSRFDPIVLSFTDGPMIEQLRQMNVQAHVIPTLKPFDFRKWGLIKRFISEQMIDVVHAHGTRANSNVSWATRSLGLPLIYTVHGWSFHPDQHPFVRKIRIIGENYLTKKSSLNISVSLSNQQSGRKYIPSFKSVVVNNGIDRQKFNPDKKFRNIRQELGISDDITLLLFIARFTSHKQPLKLLSAFATALDSNPDMHLLMVGDGDEKEQSRAIIDRLNISGKVTLEPFRHDVPDVLASADIFILPSLWEGLPIGLLEAMAMGKAVIATNVDGTKEIILNGQNGLLVETQDLISNLTQAIVKLSVDRQAQNIYGRNAIDTVNKKFNATEMTRQIENIYCQIIQNANN